jgi:hypothetical protein
METITMRVVHKSFAAAVLALLVTACNVPSNNGNESSDAGSDTSVSPDSGPGSETTADAGVSCVGTDGCYSCAPTVTEQFLNRCTDSQCSPFNNLDRLGLRPGQALPALP